MQSTAAEIKSRKHLGSRHNYKIDGTFRNNNSNLAENVILLSFIIWKPCNHCPVFLSTFFRFFVETWQEHSDSFLLKYTFCRNTLSFEGLHFPLSNTSVVMQEYKPVCLITKLYMTQSIY